MPASALLGYHDRSKHRLDRYAPGPGALDWANQPDPFRCFAGAAAIKLPLVADELLSQPFDQEKWALRYGICDLSAALMSFEASRQWNLLLINAATAEERQRPVTHPERGTMTFWTIVETMGGHDVNHLLQLERMAGAGKRSPSGRAVVEVRVAGTSDQPPRTSFRRDHSRTRFAPPVGAQPRR